MAAIGSVNSTELYNAVVVTASGRVNSAEFKGHKKGGFRIASLVNIGSGDLSCDYILEGWDDVLNDWIPEPFAIFIALPAGIAIKTSDTFPNAQAQRYRVGIVPSGGTSGPVHMSVTLQNKE